MKTYHQSSKSLYYGLVAALPLFIGYEILLLLAGRGGPIEVRNAGDVWLRMLLASLEINPAHATLAMILMLILAIPLAARKAGPLEGRYFLFMGVEALFYSLLLGLVVNLILLLLSRLFGDSSLIDGVAVFGGGPEGALETLGVSSGQSSAGPGRGLGGGTLQALALSLGAGLFEELIFRVLLMGALLYMAAHMMRRALAALAAVILSALLFSWVHYIGPFGDPLELSSFMFRFIAGLLFSGLYYWRGF
ncbi:MAG: CPBP family glutamic-type intramembrane protease, partial [Deltaproteobacteria bacterium]|nr:CPBP family glutamic-type intramembrane protease [Deltaproteobacteria bacterium]